MVELNIAKFKVGDRVRLIKADYLSHEKLPVGAVGTVLEEDDVPCVSWDGFQAGHCSKMNDPSDHSVWAVLQEQLELIDADQSA